MSLHNTTHVKEVDFEDDEWRHDSQYLTDERPVLLFDMAELEKKFPEVSEAWGNSYELLPHYIL